MLWDFDERDVRLFATDAEDDWRDTTADGPSHVPPRKWRCMEENDARACPEYIREFSGGPMHVRYAHSDAYIAEHRSDRPDPAYCELGVIGLHGSTVAGSVLREHDFRAESTGMGLYRTVSGHLLAHCDQGAPHLFLSDESTMTAHVLPLDEFDTNFAVCFACPIAGIVGTVRDNMLLIWKID